MSMEQFQPWAEGVAEKIRTKMAWASEKNRDKIPYTTGPDGSYNDLSDTNLSWWTNGFWGGIQWLLYQATGGERYAEIGRASTYKLERCLSDFYGMDHDVGFLFLLTAVADYKCTGNPDGRRIGLHAANLLAGRFNPIGRYLRAWNDNPTVDNRGWAIIDCLMNLNLLYWASEETGDPRYRQIAMLHADTAIQNVIRTDGSACHIVEFDPETGRRVRDYGGQGYQDGSAWSRGQGWAVYGFTLSYLHTGCTRYREAAQAVADYVLAHLPESGLVPIDFCQPPEPAWEDGAGAAILADGLLAHAKAVPGEAGARYREAAVRILKAMMRFGRTGPAPAMPSSRTAPWRTTPSSGTSPWYTGTSSSWRRCISSAASGRACGTARWKIQRRLFEKACAASRRKSWDAAHFSAWLDCASRKKVVYSSGEAGLSADSASEGAAYALCDQRHPRLL